MRQSFEDVNLNLEEGNRELEGLVSRREAEMSELEVRF